MLMGSVAFDGSLRVWDLRSNSLKSMFEDRTAQGKDKILNCLSWYNAAKISNEDPNRNLAVVGTAAGRIKLVDIEKNRIMWKEEYGDKNVVYDVDWSANGVLAVGGSYKELILRKFEKASQSFSKYKNISVLDSIRCLQFNPHRAYQLAVGLFNGQILIVNVDTGVIEGTYKAASSRILSLQWHPTIETMFATGSFDYVVRVHDIKKNNVVELREHKDRVRSLAWNHELPWMLCSASDDTQVIVWDLRTEKILTTVFEPTLAMTSLISHPTRPFNLISCHFDSSILFWSVLSIPDVALAQMKFLLGSPVGSFLCDSVEALSTTDHSAKLSGKQSKMIY